MTSDTGNGPPVLPKDSRARRIGQLEARMAIVVDGLLQTILGLRALAQAHNAPASYLDECTSLAERVYGATTSEEGSPPEDPGGGDGG